MWGLKGVVMKSQYTSYIHVGTVTHDHSTDIPNTSFRMATISGLADSCQKAKKMVEDIVAEVGQRDDMKACCLIFLF